MKNEQPIDPCWPDTTADYGPQSAEVWNALAHKCAKMTMRKLAERLKELNAKPMDVTQCAIVEASVFGVIIGAYHNVAEEAVKGENVTGALHAGDVAEPPNEKS